MKITKSQLKRIIKEELANVLHEQGEIRDPEKARMDITGQDVIDRTHRYAQTGVETHDPAGGLSSMARPGYARPESFWDDLADQPGADLVVEPTAHKEIVLSDGTRVKVPLMPGETTSHSAFKKRVRSMMRARAMAQEPIVPPAQRPISISDEEKYQQSLGPRSWPAALEENYMKITKSQLKRIIKEELESVLYENRGLEKNIAMRAMQHANDQWQEDQSPDSLKIIQTVLDGLGRIISGESAEAVLNEPEHSLYTRTYYEEASMGAL